MAVALAKDLEEWDRILNGDQEWIHFAFDTKLEPGGPMGVFAFDIVWINCNLQGFRCKTEIRSEFSCVER